MASRSRWWPVGVGLTVAVTGGGAASLGPAGTEAEAGPETATGVVFDDLNGNGVRDDGEPGLSDVSVSNGRDVVRTDARGRYRVVVDDETIIFITKPAGYMVPVNGVQLPQFYYLHYPNGTPHDLRYGGIEPTGALPASVDFALVEDDTLDERFSALVFADPQTRNAGEIADMAEDVVAELTDPDAEFGMTVGDVVNDPLDLFGLHNETIARIGLPWWNLPGNHDMDYDAPDDVHATDTFKSVYGPTDYSFDYGQVHFVAMDNVQHLGPDHGYRGFLDDEQLEWLANDLAHVAADQLVVIATHIPLMTDATMSAGVNTVNVAELLAVLETREHVYSFSGHDTSNSWQMYLGPDDGWNGSGHFHHQVLAEVRGGGWTTGPVDERGVPAADMADGNPNGYYEITFDGTDYTPRFKAASLPADYQMRLSLHGGRGERAWLPTGPSGSDGLPEHAHFTVRDWAGVRNSTPRVVANVFDGGERHVVEVRVDDGPVMPMEHLDPTDDPYVMALAEQYAGTPERPANPEPSSHLWSAPLPRGLRPGEHTVTVRSTDPYGQVSESAAMFEVLTGRG